MGYVCAQCDVNSFRLAGLNAIAVKKVQNVFKASVKIC